MHSLIAGHFWLTWLMQSKKRPLAKCAPTVAATDLAILGDANWVASCDGDFSSGNYVVHHSDWIQSFQIRFYSANGIVSVARIAIVACRIVIGGYALGDSVEDSESKWNFKYRDVYKTSNKKTIFIELQTDAPKYMRRVSIWRTMSVPSVMTHQHYKCTTSANCIRQPADGALWLAYTALSSPLSSVLSGRFHPLTRTASERPLH